jgi:hypothetical protein
MTVGSPLPSAPPGWAGAGERSPTLARRLLGGGIDGNERLTAVIGAVLIVLLAVIGVTILRVRQLLWVHLFVGMVLIPPVLLKLGTTGYRFTRYYTANPSYRRKGPPPALLRLIAPVVVASTLIVFISGVVLLVLGPSSRDSWLPIHKASFIVWLAFTAPHVLWHLPALGGAIRGDYRRELLHSGDVTGRAGRVISLAGVLVAGVVLGILVIPEFGTWLSAAAHFHHDH